MMDFFLNRGSLGNIISLQDRGKDCVYPTFRRPRLDGTLLGMLLLVLSNYSKVDELKKLSEHFSFQALLNGAERFSLLVEWIKQIILLHDKGDIRHLCLFKSINQ